jgi:hypothetical protein
MEDATVMVLREAFRTTGHDVADADHVLLPTGRYRRAATRGLVLACGGAGRPPEWIDLLPVVGNPAGASNLLQVAASAAMISAGSMSGPGLALSTGIQGTLSAVVLSRADLR